MPLLTGTWKINVNGAEGNLMISNVEPDGVFAGKVLDLDCHGCWNEAAQMIYFESVGAGMGNSGRAHFTGYLFSTLDNVSPGSDVKWTICGSVTGSPLGAPVANVHPTSRRISFGWMATITQVM